MRRGFNLVFSLLVSLCLSGTIAWAQRIQAMKLITAQTGWAESGQRLYWTTDGGSHWKNIAPPMSSKFGLQDVFFRDTNMGWALLSGAAEDSAEVEFELASTTNGGSDWHVTPIRIPDMAPGGMDLDGRGTIFFLDAERGWMNLWVKSGSAFRLGVLLTTDDGGRTWKWAPSGSDAGAGTVYFVTATDGWIAGGVGDEQLYVTHDGAKSWHNVALKAPRVITKDYTASYVAPIFQDRKHGFLPVTYWNGDDGEAVLVLFSSNDGGQTWETDRVLPKRGYLSGETTPSTIADSVLLTVPKLDTKGNIPLTVVPPGGKALTTITHVSGGGIGISQLSFTNPSRGWASTSNNLFSTQDGGVTWTNITPGEGSGTGRRLQPSIRGSVTPKTQGAPRVRPAEIADAGPVVSAQLGFDKCPSPTLAQMNTWWNYSPYFDVGVYLGGASVNCAVKANWLSTTEGYGWGIIPIWSGPQAPCACWPKYPKTCTPFPHVFDWDPATASNEGAQEADSATAAAIGLGLPNSVIYVDIESYNSSAKSQSGQSCGAAAQAYLDGWVGEMHLKSFYAGVYGSSVDAQTDFSQISPLPDEAWIAETPTNVAPSVTIWGLRHLCDQFSASPCPLWSTEQRIHQYLENEKETWGNVSFGVDPDIIDAEVARPSTGTKTYTYNFDQFSQSGSQDFAYSINNIGATAFYGGFINGSPSDSSGEVGQILVMVGSPEYQIWDWGTSLDLVPPPYPQKGDCYATQRYYCTFMTGMNNAGWIVGYWEDLSALNHGFLNYGGNLMSFDAPGAGTGCCGLGTFATGINDAGLIAGYYVDSNGDDHGFIYNANTLQFVGGSLDYPGNAGGTIPLGINGNAQIVGEYFDGATWQGFTYDNGNFAAIPATCGTPAVPVSINNNGQIVGSYGGFFYGVGAPPESNYFVSYDLGVNCSVFSAPNSIYGTAAYSINDAGQISGSVLSTQQSSSELSAFVAVPQTP